MLPRFYGTAWTEWNTGVVVLYPVPFNLVAKWSREAWWFIWRAVKMPRSKYDRQLARAYRAGQASRQKDIDRLSQEFMKVSTDAAVYRALEQQYVKEYGRDLLTGTKYPT